MLDVPVTVLVGADDPVVPVEAADGWRERTTQEGEMLVFPGGHFYLGGQLGEVAGVIADRAGVRARS